MSLNRAFQVVATLCVGVALILFAATCSKSPTAPQPVVDLPAEERTEDKGRETELVKVTSVNCTQGTLPSGALYEVCVPDAWNLDLVIYAHGYVRPQQPLALPDDVVGGTPVHEIITSMGYAFASTSYRRNGLVVVDAVDDLLELADVVRTEYPMINHVLLAGVSEGGLITTLAVEQHSEVFDGGVAVCGPIGNFRRQLNYIGEFRIVFDYFFPGVIPGSPVDIPEEVINNWDYVYKPQVIAAISTYPHKTEQLMRVTRAPFDAADPITIGNTVIGVLEYNIFGTNDAIEQLGGQPIHNRWKWYFGSDNDWRLNWRIQRFRADAAALAEIKTNYQTSGDLDVPLSAIHNTKDEIVPYWHEPLYRLKIFRHGSGQQHSNIPIFRYGHCNLTESEVLAAFAILVWKVTAADLLLAENVIPSTEDQTRLMTICEEFGASPKIVPEGQMR